MPTISQIEIGNVVYDIKDAVARSRPAPPIVSSLLMNSQTQEYSGSTYYSPFYSQLTISEAIPIPVILSVSGAEFIRQGVSLWTELFLESRYFNSSTSTTATYIGMQERRTSPANTSTWYNLNLVDNLAVGGEMQRINWRPVASCGQAYKIQRMRTTLLIFGLDSNSYESYEIKNSVITWTPSHP